MRLAFWRRGDDKARVQRAVSKPAPATCNSTGAPDRAPCKGRGVRSVGVVAEDLGGIGRSGRAGAGGFDAGQASFSQAINRERLSRVHLVSAGRPGSDRALLQLPRLTLAIDALLRVYDHVLLDAGTASDLSAELLTAQAEPLNALEPGPRVAAA